MSHENTVRDAAYTARMAVFTRTRAETPDAVITTARHGRSSDLMSREVRYVMTMGIRVLCFVGMALIGGPWRWVLLAGAAFLPGIAVLLANAIDKRGQITPVVHHTPYRPALPSEPSPGPERPTVLDHDD